MKNIGAVIVAVALAVTAVPAEALSLYRVKVTNTPGADLIHHKPGHYGGPPHSRGYGGYRYNSGPRYGYYNGHQGYRYQRYGYRRHSDGWWYPLAAFGAGLAIGGAIAAQPRGVYSSAGSAHVEWCLDRYRSYRPSDNTFQPYYGRRQECISPYH
jgi:hypothetical protein